MEHISSVAADVVICLYPDCYGSMHHNNRGKCWYDRVFPGGGNGFSWQFYKSIILYYRSNDKLRLISYDLYRNLRKERITHMMHRNVLSSSYVLYLSLLLNSGKVNFACENTPIKQWHP